VHVLEHCVRADFPFVQVIGAKGNAGSAIAFLSKESICSFTSILQTVFSRYN
jgi:hypothetical protein